EVTAVLPDRDPGQHRNVWSQSDCQDSLPYRGRESADCSSLCPDPFRLAVEQNWGRGFNVGSVVRYCLKWVPCPWLCRGMPAIDPCLCIRLRRTGTRQITLSPAERLLECGPARVRAPAAVRRRSRRPAP